MDESAIVARPPLFYRIGYFLRDLLPENSRQWLFPLGTFLLLIGWEFWRGLPGSRSHPELIAADLTIRTVLRFAYTASFILWTMPVRNPSRRFLWWVFLPLTLGLLAGLLALPIGYLSPASLLESKSQILLDQLRALPLVLKALDYTLYGLLAGVVVLSIALWQVRRKRMPLPVRFRGTTAVLDKDGRATPDFAHRFFMVLVLSLVLSTIFEVGVELPVLWHYRYSLPALLVWPRGYPVWTWITATYGAVIVGFCAIKIFGWDAAESFPRSRRSWRIDYGFAVLLPLAITLAPRVAFKFVTDFVFAAGGTTPFGFPPDWRDLFDPNAAHSFPWVFVIFISAWLEELVLRRFLQVRLAAELGLKRATFLTGLLWWLLPVLKGVGPIPGLRIGVPGLSELVSLLIVILYNIPLAWLYARTRSLWLCTLMHGTMLLFRQGDSAYTFYFNRPVFYWIEVAAWVFTCFYLFRKYPVESSQATSHRSDSPEPGIARA